MQTSNQACLTRKPRVSARLGVLASGSAGTLQIGTAHSAGFGTGTPSVSYIIGPEITNANSISELGGISVKLAEAAS
jgi:hypothetical protein